MNNDYLSKIAQAITAHYELLVSNMIDFGEGRCNRCHQLIDGFRSPTEGECTAGYYLAAGWMKYCNPGEIIVCDRCMWSDQRYIAVYGETE